MSGVRLSDRSRLNQRMPLRLLRQLPGRRERGVYLAVIAVLTLSQLVVMGAYRSEQQARAEHADAWETMARGMADGRGHDALYIPWLEGRLARYEAGDPKVWREFALTRAAVIQSETPKERVARKKR